MARENEVLTLTDEQVTDLRYVLDTADDCRSNAAQIIRSADIEITDGKVVHLRYREVEDDFVIEL